MYSINIFLSYKNIFCRSDASQLASGYNNDSLVKWSTRQHVSFTRHTLKGPSCKLLKRAIYGGSFDYLCPRIPYRLVNSGRWRVTARTEDTRYFEDVAFFTANQMLMHNWRRDCAILQFVHNVFP